VIYDFAVIGGDMRQVYLANYLKNQRYQVITYATKKEGSECKEGKSFENVIREAKCIIGPVVFSKNGEITGSSINKKMSVETLLQEMTKEQILFGGCINEEIRHECEQKEIKAFDFMKMSLSTMRSQLQKVRSWKRSRCSRSIFTKVVVWSLAMEDVQKFLQRN
jgi:dipicolinate synthase subunit A